MTYEYSTYRGDKEFSVATNGDVVVGDNIRFDRACFGGGFRNPVFLCFERVTGVVVSAGKDLTPGRQTFTIQLASGKKTKIMGRNLFKHGVWRKRWQDEGARLDRCDCHAYC